MSRNLPAVIEPAPLRVVACTNPFKQGYEEYSLSPSKSLLEVLQEVQPNISDYSAHVWVEDDYIPPELWPSIYVGPGANITIRVIPKGGAARIIGTIFIAVAAIAAAFFTAGASIFTATGMLAGYGGIAGGLAGLGVGIVGTLALNALIPPMSPARQSQLALGGHTAARSLSGAESPTLSITGASNQANKYGPIPLVLGRHKIYPAYGAETYTMVVGPDQYLNL